MSKPTEPTKPEPSKPAQKPYTAQAPTSKFTPPGTPAHKAAPKEERPPEKVSEIEKQMNKLEAQSLTSDQEDAVAEIRRIMGITPDVESEPLPEQKAQTQGPEPKAQHLSQR